MQPQDTGMAGERKQETMLQKRTKEPQEKEEYM
jgi:hypothetical protein